MRMSWFEKSSLAALLLVAACDPNAGSAPSAGPEIGDVETLSQPFDLQGAVDRARLGYRRDDTGGFVSERTAQTVRAREGVVEVLARHWTEAEDSGKTKAVEATPFSLETVAIARDIAYDLGYPETSVDGDANLLIRRGIAEERFINDATATEQTWRFEQRPEGKGELTVHVAVSGLAYVGWNEDGHHFIDESTQVGIVYGVATWIDATGKAAELRVDFADGELVLTVPEEVVDASVYPAVLDPTIQAQFALNPAVVGPSFANDDTPATAFDGTNYFVVWADQRNGTSYDIYGARVSAAGAVLDNTSIPIATDVPAATAAFDQVAPAIAFNGTNYLVVWADAQTGNFDIRGALLDTAGTVITGPFAVSVAAGDQQNPAVAANGADFLVAWQDGRTGVDNTFYGRVTAAGAPLDGNGISVDAGPSIERLPTVACGTTNCLVSWQEGDVAEDIHAVRISGASLVGAVAVITAENGRDLRPDIAFDSVNGNYMIVWGRSEISAKRMRAVDGELLDMTPIRISNGPSSERSPAIAFDGANYYVAWQDGRNGTIDIFGARVTAAGVVTDVNGIALSTAGRNQLIPSITFGAGRFFTVWQDDRSGRTDIFSTRVNTNGTPSNSGGVFVSRGQLRQSAPAIRFDGDNYVVAFASAEPTGTGAGNQNNIRVVRLNHNGVILDPGGRAISAATNNQSAPKLAFGGGQFLIVWADFRNGTNFDVFGARMSGPPNYNLLDGSGIQIGSGAGDQTFPAVAHNAQTNTFLVVWQDRSNGTDYDIRGARVTAAGAVLDASPGLAVGVATRDQTHPSVASSPTNWFVAWTDHRASATPDTEDIFGVLVSGNGTVGASRIVNNRALRQDNAKVVHNGTNYLVVWTDRRAGLLNADIYGRNVLNTGSLQPPTNGVALVTGALSQERPAITVAGPNYFMVWKQSTGAGTSSDDLFGRRFTFTPAPLVTAGEPAAFPISQLDFNEDEPAVAARNEFNTMVVYQRFDATPSVRSVHVEVRRVLFP